MDEDDLEAFDDVDPALAADLDPEPEVDPLDPPEPQDDDPPASRGDRDYGRLRAERRAAEERAERAEREAAEIRARYESQQTQETASQREQRLAAMDPYERDMFLRDERMANLERQLVETRHQSLEREDAVNFKALCTSNPMVAKLKDKVEAVFNENKAKGTVVPREVIAKFLLGEQIMEKGAKAITKQTGEAATRKAAQTGKPTGSRGDAPGSDKRQVDEREARRLRLENVRL